MATAVNSTTLPGSPILHLLAQASRADIEATIEALIARLDVLDGDPDLEPEPELVAEAWHRDTALGDPDDAEDTYDREMDLGDMGEPPEANRLSYFDGMCLPGERLSVRVASALANRGFWTAVTQTGEVVPC